MVIQSVMLSPCGGHKAVWDNDETPGSPMPWNPRPPTPGSPAPGTPRPPTPRSPTAGKPCPSRRRPTTRLPAVTRTSGRIPCRQSTTRHRNSRVRKPPPQLSVTKKTKVSGKKQARDSKKKRKRELVNRADSWQGFMEKRQSWTFSSARVTPP